MKNVDINRHFSFKTIQNIKHDNNIVIITCHVDLFFYLCSEKK